MPSRGRLGRCPPTHSPGSLGRGPLVPSRGRLGGRPRNMSLLGLLRLAGCQPAGLDGLHSAGPRCGHAGRASGRRGWRLGGEPAQAHVLASAEPHPLLITSHTQNSISATHCGLAGDTVQIIYCASMMGADGAPVHARSRWCWWCWRCWRLCLRGGPVPRRVFLEDLEDVFHTLADLECLHMSEFMPALRIPPDHNGLRRTQELSCMHNADI